MPTPVKAENWQLHAVNGDIDWDLTTMRLMMLSSVHTTNPATQEFISDVNANEISAATGYTAGGIALANITILATSGTTTVDADDIVFAVSASGFTTARTAILFADSGTPATSPIVSFLDMLADQGNVNGSLTIQWSGSNGIFTQT